MLSRSNSNAADRLRRAKSTSSAHTSSSGHQRSSTSIDPFVTRQQAETAALEAYHRAQRFEEPAQQAYRAVPPKLQRPKSQVTGKSEGGHFEDARLGRRRSRSRRDGGGDVKLSRGQHQRQSEITDDSTGDEHIVTRRRSVIPPNPNNKYNQFDNSSLPSSTRFARKSQYEYSDGSPVPRHTSTSKERSSARQLEVPPSARKNRCGDSIHQFSDFSAPDEVGEESRTPKVSTRGRQNDNHILAVARDKCLQDLPQKKIRERKSFILAPFQKKRATNTQRSSYDTSLPPSNYADEDFPLPSSPPLPIPISTTQPAKSSRNFSESLKGRFKKVFRKASPIPSGIPAQHVEAKHFHYSISPLPTPTVEPEKEEDPFVVAATLAVPETKHDSTSSRSSVGEDSAARSRVTSWTNSIVAGTCSSRAHENNSVTADEQGRLQRSDSVSTLRKASSFFGRSFKNRLHRTSKAELRGSEESTGLYSALQERINSAEPENETSSGNKNPESRTTSALATLPSQQQSYSTGSNRTSWAAPTIRSVTPDPTSSKLDVPSPITEVLSPDGHQSASAGLTPCTDENSNPTPRSQLQRRPAMKAPTPSKEQIQQRVERSKNRWQSPLDELSPSMPRSTRTSAMDDNPYEMRSLSRTLYQPIENNDMPRHAKVGEPTSAERQNVMSPSVYSRGTDGAMPRPETPVDPHGMMVTITGREVRSYSISPPKRQQRAENQSHASGDWRRWLSGEMSGWDGTVAPADFTIPKRVLMEPEVTSNNSSTAGQPPNSVSSPLEARVARNIKQRPAADGRRPSYEDERYYVDGSNDNSSDEDVKAEHAPKAEKHMVDEGNGRRPVGQPIPSRRCHQDEQHSGTGSMNGRPRTISKHQSIAQFGSTSHIDERLDACSGHLSTGYGSSKDDAFAKKAAYKPKSAFDLRANYKCGNKDKAKPIEVRRKPNHNETMYMLEDTTIQNISAGPYASQPATADANKENTPPSDANGLPMLSSSEWLAAGTGKQRDARKPSTIHPALRDRSLSRYSPSRTTKINPSGSSPGQRLASNWLEGRRSKENSPAFV